MQLLPRNIDSIYPLPTSILIPSNLQIALLLSLRQSVDMDQTPSSNPSTYPRSVRSRQDRISGGQRKSRPPQQILDRSEQKNQRLTQETGVDATTSEKDVNSRLMRRYEHAPMSWYLDTFIAMPAIGIFIIKTQPVYPPLVKPPPRPPLHPQWHHHSNHKPTAASTSSAN